MCKIDIDSKVEEVEFTGYKVVIKKGNHYYSPATGIEYTLGSVKVPKKKGKNITSYFINVLDRKMSCYNPLMTGRTAVFKNYNAAYFLLQQIPNLQDAVTKYNFYDKKKLEIVKMTIRGNLKKGSYLESSVVVGTEIRSIKKTNLIKEILLLKFL